MKTHAVIGASAVCLATANILAARGKEVMLITRSGSGRSISKMDSTDQIVFCTMIVQKLVKNALR
ncbi:MAG TPA: hypothetical protein VN040_16100 [Pseudosphingobacterium sp.]|nr:hypothetical protein [Pseudosphingobacterium sp.]